MNTILYTVHTLDYDRGCQSQVHIYKMFIIHSSAKKRLAACQGIPIQAGELSHDIDR